MSSTRLSSFVVAALVAAPACGLFACASTTTAAPAAITVATPAPPPRPPPPAVVAIAPCVMPAADADAAAAGSAATTTTGAIRGVVCDSRNGEALAGVTVVATSPALQGTQTAITDDRGVYVIAALPPGDYLVTYYYADLTQAHPNAHVGVGREVSLVEHIDGGQSGGEVILIRGDAPVVDQTSTSQGITIDREYMKNIPVPGRTFDTALGAAGGAQHDGTSFSGSTSLENQYYIDGVNATGVTFALGATPPGARGAPMAPDPTSPEQYARLDDNPFVRTEVHPLSTFSTDVDTASYANTRRFLHEGHLPPKDAVRIEELLNYFRYSYPAPTGKVPVSITTEVGPSPWNPSYKLVRIGLQTRAIADANVPPRNLVFLLDVSGSMDEPQKLPLLQQAMGLVVDQLRPQDRVAIVVYAGDSGLALPSTPGTDKVAIRAALAALTPGGGTNGSGGIELAYKIAQDSFIKNGINRVILCTDGDFNLGVTGDGALTRLIEGKRDHGVFLTVLGFGMGNLKDATMEQLADRGNGNYAYIDTLAEARKVLVREAGATLVTVAKDVKLQIEMNPARVAGYRLIGYEDRKLDDADFANDAKDAGDLGAGHAVTALYEIVPAGVAVPASKVDKLKYQRPSAALPASASRELMTVKVRYKAPDGDRSSLIAQPVLDRDAPLAATSIDFRWAMAVAGFGMLLHDSPERGTLAWPMVASLAAGAVGRDTEGYRRELVELVKLASTTPP